MQIQINHSLNKSNQTQEAVNNAANLERPWGINLLIFRWTLELLF